MPEARIRTIRSGLVVPLHTSITGNRQYMTTLLEGVHLDEEGRQRSRWDTLRITDDPEEYNRAKQAVSKARGVIVNVCTATSGFGLMCPEEKEQDLLKALDESQRLVREFNDTATITRIDVRVVPGRIVADDVIATQAIAAEVRGLLEDVEDGLATLNSDKVKKACDKLRDTGVMLSDDAQARVKGVIDAARLVARKIVKAGDEVVVAIDQATIEKAKAARVSFLDLDGDAGGVQTPEEGPGVALDLN
jgi:hypothetical protein